VNGKFSGWRKVLSGVPQGSVLGLILFNIFINDLDDTATARQLLKKFADDTKIGQIIESPSDAQELQATLDWLCEWAATWGTYVGLYKQYVRPHLEFATPAWAPGNQGNIDTLERVQERAVRAVSGLRGRTYSERLQELCLPTLVQRREEVDMIMTYKLLSDSDKDYSAKWFAGPRTTTGANSSA
jgi:hypothetical protein